MIRAILGAHHFGPPFGRSYLPILANGGPDRVRTDDLLDANQALSQLSYGPLKSFKSMGGAGISRCTLS